MLTGLSSRDPRNGLKDMWHTWRHFVRPGVEVVNLGLMDSPQRSQAAAHQCRREDTDVPLLYVTAFGL
jgi:hypothetical protein